MQPDWAQRLLRVPHRRRVEIAARRTAMSVGLNALHYASGPVTEARQARKRVEAVTPATDRAEPASPLKINAA
jgi:hypothetical protein